MWRDLSARALFKNMVTCHAFNLGPSRYCPRLLRLSHTTADDNLTNFKWDVLWNEHSLGGARSIAIYSAPPIVPPLYALQLNHWVMHCRSLKMNGQIQVVWNSTSGLSATICAAPRWCANAAEMNFGAFALSVITPSCCVSSQIKEKTTLIHCLKLPRGAERTASPGLLGGLEALGVWFSNLLHRPDLLFVKGEQRAFVNTVNITLPSGQFVYIRFKHQGFH